MYPGTHFAGGPPSPQPGWYFDGYTTRWWDGYAWGAPATAPPEDTTLAVLVHLSFLIGTVGFVAPLVLYLVKPKGSFARHHAREALNFQLTTLVAALVMLAFLFGSLIALPPDQNDAPIGMFVFIGLWGLLSLATWILGAVGAIRAGQQRRWRYPVQIPFVRP